MKTKESLKFVGYVAFVHCITYFICGVIFSQLMRYSYWWQQPVICDYFRAFEGGASAAGPFIQVIRGLLFGLILLPFRDYLAEKKQGWLYLWLLFVGIGIIGTPAAAPSSIEGVVYSRLPFIFHFVGLPEISSQTFLFSVFVWRYISRKDKKPGKGRLIAGAFFSAIAVFIVYALISIVFAVVQKVPIESGSADIKVMGQFFAPVILVFICHLIKVFKPWIKAAGLYVLSAAAFLIYQTTILHDTGMVFALVAPMIATLFYYLIMMIYDRLHKEGITTYEDRDRH